MSSHVFIGKGMNYTWIVEDFFFMGISDILDSYTSKTRERLREREREREAVVVLSYQRKQCTKLYISLLFLTLYHIVTSLNRISCYLKVTLPPFFKQAEVLQAIMTSVRRDTTSLHYPTLYGWWGDRPNRRYSFNKFLFFIIFK